VETVALSPNGLDRYELSARPDCVLVATRNGVIRLDRAAGRWSLGERSLSGVHASAVLLDEQHGTVYAASHGEGIFRRRAGADWVPISSGLSSRNVFSLACANGTNGRVLYAGTEPAYLFRSLDDGDTWEELPALHTIPGRETWTFPAPPHVAHTKHIDIDPRDQQTIYLAIEQGALLRSTDAGLTFEELHFADATYDRHNDVHRIVFNPRNPDDLYMPGGDGIALSRDAGRTWKHLTTADMRVGYPDASFFSPDGSTLFVAGADQAPSLWRQNNAANGTVVRSRDGGETWDEPTFPARRGNVEALTMAIWPGGYGFFAGTSEGEVFESDDRGESWRRIAGDLPPISKCIHYAILEPA
jgi:photosystem II stability/assembly factor-like uncharacterized protein